MSKTLTIDMIDTVERRIKRVTEKIKIDQPIIDFEIAFDKDSLKFNVIKTHVKKDRALNPVINQYWIPVKYGKGVISEKKINEILLDIPQFRKKKRLCFTSK